MVYCEEQSRATKRTQFYGKLIVESPEDTMWETQRQGRYGEADSSGLQH